MAPLRIRYSQGVATIDVDLENATVQELQQEIRKATNILPSQQEGTSPSLPYYELNADVYM